MSKYKINCYIKEIPEWLKKIKIPKDEGYIDIKNDFGKWNLMLQCNTHRINLKELKKLLIKNSKHYFWLDDGTYYYKKIKIEKI